MSNSTIAITGHRHHHKQQQQQQHITIGAYNFHKKRPHSKIFQTDVRTTIPEGSNATKFFLFLIRRKSEMARLQGQSAYGVRTFNYSLNYLDEEPLRFQQTLRPNKDHIANTGGRSVYNLCCTLPAVTCVDFSMQLNTALLTAIWVGAFFLSW